MVVTTKSEHYDFYKQEVDRAIKDCRMWNDRVRLIVYTTIITETCDGRPFGWLNYTNPREPQFASFKPNDGDPPNKSWSTQRSGGLFQQQPQYWGPDVMDPYKTTVSFLVGYRFQDGRSAAGLAKINYENLPIHVSCQMVQGSEFGDGSNYKRNIPYAQMVIDSDRKEFLPMGNYSDPDDFMNRHLVAMGGDQSKTESLHDSIQGTNRGIFSDLPDLIRRTRTTILDAVSAIPNAVADNILNRRWVYWNQDAVEEKDRGTNTLVENVFATNGRVYHPAWGNKALSDKLDTIIELLKETHPGTDEPPSLSK